MSSYFDEHNCEPLPDSDNAAGSGLADNLMEFARFLILTGNWNNAAFSDIFGNRPPPPTSADFIENLEKRIIRDEDECGGSSCPVCLKKYDQDDELTTLPCNHEFHVDCLVPWLKKTSSCPMCRYDLPTDDPEWEEMRRQKKRQKQREKDLEQLHDSMFG